MAKSKALEPTDADIDRAQRRLEHLIGKEWLMAGVKCLDCGKPWEKWDDKEGDHCGCEGPING